MVDWIRKSRSYIGILIALMFCTMSVFALPCINDVHCTSLGAQYACDTAANECVELDAALISTLSAQGSSQAASQNTQDTTTSSSSTLTTESSLSEPAALATTQESASPAVSLNNRIQTIETQLDLLASRVDQLEGGVDRLDTGLSQVSQGQEAIESQLGGQLNTVSVGLASLQQNIASVEEEIAAREQKAARTRLLLFVGIALLTFAVLSYLIVMHQMRSRVSQRLDPQVRDYISSQIKRGASQTQILSALQHQGWSQEQAEFAYKKTAFENYHEYEKAKGTHPKQTVKAKRLQDHHSKMLVVSLITIAIVAVLLFVASNSTGQAISTQQLPLFVQSRLSEAIEVNPSYSSVDFVEACLETTFQGQNLRYILLKTPQEFLLKSVESCEGIYDVEQDFSTLDELLLCVGAMPLDQLNQC